MSDDHEEIPAITLVVDGGWSKPSRKYSYNANSGVAIIVGKATGKLLHIGVCNKFHTACARTIPQEQHTCFKNRTESSSQTDENDIIIERFKCCRGALEKLVQDNPSYKGRGGLTLNMRRRLVSAARCVIRMHSKETD